MFGWWLLMVLAGVVHGNSFERNRTISRRLKTQGALPTIFIVGAQKAGSSSLFELMIGHPFLLKGIHKETHFFDGDREYAHGEEYYSSTYFPLRKAATTRRNVSSTEHPCCTRHMFGSASRRR